MNWREWFAAKLAMPMNEHIRLAKALKCDPRHTAELWPFALVGGLQRQIAAYCGESVLLVAHDGTMQSDDDIFGEPVIDLDAGKPVKAYTNGLRYCRDWAATGEVPGYALAAPIASIRHFGPLMAAPSIRLDVAARAGELSRAMLQSARLPRIK